MTTHHLDTRLLHIGAAEFNPETGTAPVSIPAIRTSTVRFKNLDVLDRAYDAIGDELGHRPPTPIRVEIYPRTATLAAPQPPTWATPSCASNVRRPTFGNKRASAWRSRWSKV